MDLHINYLVILSVFVGFDILTGLIKAVATKTLSSQKMREGLFHKLSFYIAYALAIAIEFASGTLDLGYSIPLAPIVTGYIALTEIVSIVENMCEINPELQDSKISSLFKPKSATK